MMPLLEVRDLACSLAKKSLFQNVHFQVEKGEHVSLQGPSGAGKSCLLAILAGLITPCKGNIFFSDSSSQNVLRNRSFIGFVPQENIFLSHENVFFNALLTCRITSLNREATAYEDYAKELLQHFNLDHDISPQALSGGEKRKLSVIRALILRPKLLLLDEYASGLDADNKYRVWQVLQSTQSAMLMVTHDDSLAQRCSKRLFFYHGNVETHSSTT